jgi:hypothetical protein
MSKIEGDEGRLSTSAAKGMTPSSDVAVKVGNVTLNAWAGVVRPSVVVVTTGFAECDDTNGGSRKRQCGRL